MTKPVKVITSTVAFFTKGQSAFVATVAAFVGILLGLQSYVTLPYQMAEAQRHVLALENDRRTDRDLIIALQTQLAAARDEMHNLRDEIVRLRSELRLRPASLVAEGIDPPLPP